MQLRKSYRILRNDAWSVAVTELNVSSLCNKFVVHSSRKTLKKVISNSYAPRVNVLTGAPGLSKHATPALVGAGFIGHRFISGKDCEPRVGVAYNPCTTKVLGTPGSDNWNMR